MAMTGGIGYEIDQLAELGVPELMRRQSVDPQLKYALALQEATKMVEAAARERDMSQQMPMPADVVGQMETSLAKRLAPGVQQQGQRSMQMQNRAAMGLPGQAAPNLARMAQGGIVGYQDGGDVMGPPEPNLYQRMGQGLKNYGANAQESMDMLRAAKAGVGVPYEERSAAIKQVRDEITAQKQNRDPNFIQRMGQKLMDAGLNVEESKSILKKFYDTFGKTYEEMSNGMAMGGEVKGYAGGGEIKAYLASMGQDISDFTEAQIEAIGQMLDSQVARGQNDTLRQVGRGAMGLLRDRMPATTSMPQAGIDAREADIEQRRGGLGALLASDESGPSVTEQLEAAERKISAEGRGQSTGRNVSPGRAAAARRRELRDQMPDQETGPSLYERTKGYMPDFGAIAGMDMGEFARGSGLVDAAKAVDESGFFSGLEDALANIITEVPEDASKGYRAGVRTRDILSAPYDIISGFIQPTRGDWTTIGDIVEGTGEFSRGVMGRQPSTTDSVPTPTATTPTTAPVTLTEADIFRRDAPAGLVSAIDKAEGERAAMRAMFPNAPERTAKQRTEDRAKLARATATPQESGIRGLLQKAKPFADKAADIAQILGRGAGASKGFEFAKIAEESRKIDQAEQARQDEIEKAKADRTARAELLREEYGFRDKELRSKLLSESMAGEREADRELLENIMTSIESDPEFLRAAEEFKDTYDVFFGSYDKDKYAEALAKKRQELIEKRFNEAKSQLASVLGGSSSASAMDDLAKYNI